MVEFYLLLEVQQLPCDIAWLLGREKCFVKILIGVDNFLGNSIIDNYEKGQIVQDWKPFCLFLSILFIWLAQLNEGMLIVKHDEAA